MTAYLALEINGTTLPLVATTPKPKTDPKTGVVTTSTNTYFVFRDPNKDDRGFGHDFKALGSDLPTSVKIDGHEIALEAGFTSGEYKGVVKPVKARNAASGVFTSSTLGEPRRFKVAVTVRKDGRWNITASVFGIGGGTSASPEVSGAKDDAIAAWMRENA